MELVQRRFSEIDEAFAFDEGEGDRTLTYWRTAHQSYFERHGTFSPDMVLFFARGSGQSNELAFSLTFPSWFVIKGSRVDFLYRRLRHVREVIERCCEGKSRCRLPARPSAGLPEPDPSGRNSLLPHSV